jgi:hypothetical protein
MFRCVRAGGEEGRKGDHGDWARGQKMWQLTLSKGTTRVEVHSFVQKATIPSKRLSFIFKVNINILKVLGRMSTQDLFWAK